ncbi:BTB/POZ domain-containing protein KCTD9 [Pelomyxa schiedti]|nr:BTB/POZ domain-containing protein KCTD9 [Pelomyxa schiedti]
MKSKRWPRNKASQQPNSDGGVPIITPTTESPASTTTTTTTTTTTNQQQHHHSQQQPSIRSSNTNAPSPSPPPSHNRGGPNKPTSKTVFTVPSPPGSNPTIKNEDEADDVGQSQSASATNTVTATANSCHSSATNTTNSSRQNSRAKSPSVKQLQNQNQSQSQNQNQQHRNQKTAALAAGHTHNHKQSSSSSSKGASHAVASAVNPRVVLKTSSSAKGPLRNRNDPKKKPKQSPVEVLEKDKRGEGDDEDAISEETSGDAHRFVGHNVWENEDDDSDDVRLRADSMPKARSPCSSSSSPRGEDTAPVYTSSSALKTPEASSSYPTSSIPILYGNSIRAGASGIGLCGPGSLAMDSGYIRVAVVPVSPPVSLPCDWKPPIGKILGVSLSTTWQQFVTLVTATFNISATPLKFYLAAQCNCSDTVTGLSVQKPPVETKSSLTSAFPVSGELSGDLALLRDGDLLYVATPDVLHAHPLLFYQHDRSNNLHAVCSPQSRSHLHSRPGGGKKSDWVSLNVGGRVFTTTKSTLTKCPGSVFSLMFRDDWDSTRDSQGNILIDRSPEYFEVILTYLRGGSLVINQGLNPLGVFQEAKFFGLTDLQHKLKILVDEQQCTDGFSRKDFVGILLSASTNSSLRCQGLNLAGINLSKLDLSHINFKMTNFRNADLSNCSLDYCLLQGATFEGCNATRASFRGSNLCGANLCNANFRGANFEDRGGVPANLEGANMRGAVLEDGNLCGADLRAAILRGANLSNCNLLRANFAGADLEDADLRGANLQKANLASCNLKNALLDFKTVNSRS